MCHTASSLPHYATTHPRVDRIVRSAKQRDATLRKSRRSFWRGREGGGGGGGRQRSLRIKEQQRGTPTSSSSFPPDALFKLSITNRGSRALTSLRCQLARRLIQLCRFQCEHVTCHSCPNGCPTRLSEEATARDTPACLPAYRHLLHDNHQQTGLTLMILFLSPSSALSGGRGVRLRESVSLERSLL